MSDKKLEKKYSEWYGDGFSENNLKEAWYDGYKTAKSEYEVKLEETFLHLKSTLEFCQNYHLFLVKEKLSEDKLKKYVEISIDAAMKYFYKNSLKLPESER